LQKFRHDKALLPFLISKEAKIGVVDETLIAVLSMQTDMNDIDTIDTLVKLSEIELPWKIIFFESLSRSNTTLARHLLDKKYVTVGDVNDIGNTALHSVAYNSLISISKYLFTLGAEAEACNKYGETPLHVAAGRGNLLIVNALIERGVDVNVTNITGDTPLLLAAYYGHENVVKKLLEAGADVSLKNNKGWKASSRARAKGYKSISKLLRAKATN
jgi:ankyrin repeat protein